MMAAGGLTEDQLESAVLKTMGRCFLAPDDQQPDNETEIWISIGESKTGLRMYPHYHPLLSSVCTEAQYYTLTDAMRKVNPLSACGSHTLGGRYCCVLRCSCHVAPDLILSLACAGVP
jgi:hypothetical protein